MKRTRWALVLMMWVGLAGCPGEEHPERAHEHGGGDHGHEHGPDAIGITRFTDALELYAEHPPAVTGQPLPFLAHLTLLRGFRPLEDAVVTLTLDGPAHAEAQVEKMLRPGIFRPELVAPQPGTYQGRLRVEGAEVKDVLEDFEVVVFASAEAAAAASEDGAGAAGPEPVGFLKEQQWQVPFATAFAQRGTLVPTLEVVGEVTTPPSGQAEVGAAITGRVVAPQAGLPRPGQAVKQGELLATIAPAPAAPEAGARADLAVVEAEARVQAARAAVARAERLIADRAIAQREVDEARRELVVAEEAVQAARRAREVFTGAASGRGQGLYRVSSPITGVVVAVEATEGRSVTAGELLFRVMNLDELWIRARVPEQQAALIHAEEDGAFQLAGLQDWLPLKVTGPEPDAVVVNVGRTVDPRSRTVDVIYGLRRPDARLRVGAMVRVAVPAGPPWSGVVVPRGAVLEDEGRAVLYVQVEGEAFEERAVTLGPRSGDRVAISRGLAEGERVVTLGANIIRLSSRATSAPAHGHVH